MITAAAIPAPSLARTGLSPKRLFPKPFVFNEPCWTRTSDPLIKSQFFCHNLKTPHCSDMPINH